MAVEDDEPPDIFKGALPDATQLECYKRYRVNEKKTMSAFKSLISFVSFLLILGIVCYGNQDYHQYLIGREVKALLPRSKKVIYSFNYDLTYFNHARPVDIYIWNIKVSCDRQINS